MFGYGVIRGIYKCRRWESNPHAQRTLVFETSAYTNSATSANIIKIKWSRRGSNSRPLECHSSTLPTELRPRKIRLKSKAKREEKKLKDQGSLKFCFYLSPLVLMMFFNFSLCALDVLLLNDMTIYHWRYFLSIKEPGAMIEQRFGRFYELDSYL